MVSLCYDFVSLIISKWNLKVFNHLSYGEVEKLDFLILCLHVSIFNSSAS